MQAVTFTCRSLSLSNLGLFLKMEVELIHKIKFGELNEGIKFWQIITYSEIINFLHLTADDININNYKLYSK